MGAVTARRTKRRSNSYTYTAGMMQSVAAAAPLASRREPKVGERERKEKDGGAKEKKKEKERERERRKRGVEGGFAQLEQATMHNGGRQARGRDSNKRGGGCKKEHASERVVAPQWRNFRSSSCYDYDYIERYR